jgi:hypothetical protein
MYHADFDDHTIKIVHRKGIFTLRQKDCKVITKGMSFLTACMKMCID